ncbi:MAG: hypothetical protein WBR15_08305 [Gammaproteobacteria bacterium]
MLSHYAFTVALVAAIAIATNADAVKQQVPANTPFEAISSLAAKGDVDAKACLASMYYYGWGVQRDYTKAYTLTKKTADSGNPDGQLAIGEMYLNGTGVPYNQEKALAIFQGLLHKGYTRAAEPIGRMYFYGQGVSRNYNIAFAWFKKAAASGFPFAEVELATMYKKGLGVRPNAVKAQKLLQRAVTAKFTCPPNFTNISSFIVNANLELPKKGQLIGKPTGMPMVFRSGIVNGKADNPVIVQTSGYPALDAAYIQAFKRSTFPAWPDVIPLPERYVRLFIFRSPLDSNITLDKVFSEEIVASIWSAVVLPRHTLLYGSIGSDVVTVSFDYMNGTVIHVKVKYSSNDKYEDAAVVAGVKSAKYPKTPSAYTGKVLHLSVTYSFASYLPGQNRVLR